ncbi:MAG: hypothetical protein EHM23_10150 [Acidobacteria bacterium]|nr:MAG: hypothetical protein EHM23_10150 [Acidobacteriota bacterium]
MSFPGLRSSSADSRSKRRPASISRDRDHPLYTNLQLKTPARLQYYLDQGFDVARSLWDRESLIVDIDIEYVNFDFPAEPYLDVNRTFDLQQPVALATQKVLLRSGISPCTSSADGVITLCGGFPAAET